MSDSKKLKRIHHIRIRPEVLESGVLHTYGKNRNLCDRFVSYDMLQGEYIIAYEKVYVIGEPDNCPVNNKLAWSFGSGTGSIVFNLIPVVNITKGHILWLGQYIDTDKELTTKQVQFLQRQGDVEKYISNCFYNSEYDSHKCNQIMQLYNSFIFNAHMESL